jgi:hypothetical protein
MCRNHAVRRVLGERLTVRWQHCEYEGSVGNDRYGGGLHKGSSHRRHGLAAVLCVMTLRCARHRITTFHCLLGCCRSLAVKCVRAEGDREYR